MPAGAKPHYGIYVVRSGGDLVDSIGHQDRVGVLELGGEQTIEGVVEVNGGQGA